MEFTPSGKVYIEQGRQEGNEAKNPTKQDQNDRKTTPLHAPSRTTPQESEGPYKYGTGMTEETKEQLLSIS